MQIYIGNCINENYALQSTTFQIQCEKLGGVPAYLILAVPPSRRRLLDGDSCSDR
jgi:hypothetical protein